MKSADCIVATSPQEKEILCSLASSRKDIEIIPCGTDFEHFNCIPRSQSRSLLHLPIDVKIVLYVGRFDPLKGIETLVHAVAQSKFCQQENLLLIIIGGSRPGQADEKEYKRINNIVEDLGIKNIIAFVGCIQQHDLPSYYAAADVCVVPSYYELFGLVAIEAMASGIPVIASNVGGLQFTVIHEVTGLLVPPQDASALVDSIDRILSNPVWSNELGQAGRKRVKENFGWAQVAKKLSNLYGSLLTPK